MAKNNKSSGIEASARARPIIFARSAVHCHNEPITTLGEALPLRKA